MAKSEWKRRQQQQNRVVHVVECYLFDLNADLWNWADEALEVDAMAAMFAAAAPAAAVVEQLAAAMAASVSETLTSVAEGAFGRRIEVRSA